jgi:dTDP-glucose 4,6-dehydratase
LKTLLIIGGTGFFGNSILSYFSNSKILKRKFNKIIVISRNKLATFRYTKKLKKNYNIIKINCDILKLKKLPKADYVIYAAILKNYRDDYLAVKKYTKLAKIYHSKSKILYTSSGAVYGQQSNKIKGFKENYLNYNKKINFKKGYKQSYANFKLKSEKLFEKMGNEGLDVSIARCFAFVGEYLPLNSNFVIGNIIQNILEGASIKINANYKIFRSYMHADDLVKWLLKILHNSNTQCPIYNVGSDQGTDIRKLGFDLSRKYKLGVKFEKIVSNFEDRYVPSIQKAKKELKLRLKYNSLDAVNDVIHSIQNKL